MLVILVRGKGEECRRFEFAREIVTIGRAEGNDVVLPTAQISKRHARLSVTRDGVLLTDIRSTNGTYVNGRKLLVPLVITEHDRIHIGDFVLAIEDPEGADAQRAPSGGTPSSLSPLFPRSATNDNHSAGRFAVESAIDQPDSAAPTPVLPSPAVMARGWAEPPRRTGPSSSSSGGSGTGSSGEARRGRAHSLRLPWLDEWLLSDMDTHARRDAVDDLARGPVEPVVALVSAQVPPLLELGAPVVLRLFADARAGAEPGPQRSAARCMALEVSLCFPDGGLEAAETEQGLLQVSAGRRSAELSFVLRAVAAGPVRIEVGLSHRGARLATLALRSEVQPREGPQAPRSDPAVTRPGSGPGVPRLSPVSIDGRRSASLRAVDERRSASLRAIDDDGGAADDVLGVALIESLQRGSEPQAVLRVREFGGTAAAHMTPSGARRRRLWAELCLVHGETTQALAAGDMVLELSLQEQIRALYGAPEVEMLGQIHGRLREAALRSLGETLAVRLLPAAVREALQGLPAGVWLHIDATDLWVPWELLCLGRGAGAMFFAERFAVTRGGLGTQTSRFGLMPRLLLTPPGTERLARREQQALTVLDPHLRQIHLLSEVQPYLHRPGIAGWHLSWHRGFDREACSAAVSDREARSAAVMDRGDKSAAGLHLQDGVLTPVQVPVQRFHRSGSAPSSSGSGAGALKGSFFFINVSERGPAATPLAPAGTALWVERLLSAGAGAVVATTWPVPGERAGHFAEAFYRAWASGHPLTLAAAEAREQIREEGDVAWLSYAVYGLPGARLE